MKAPLQALICLTVALPASLLRADAPFLWGVTGTAGAASTLYAIHPTTGKATRVGDTGLENVSGISVHPTTKVLYGTQGQLGGTKSLLILNKRTAAASAIGDLGEAIADSAFSPAGTFFIYGASSRDLYTANPSTAAKTTIKADAAATGACGMTFDNGGNLYMTRKNGNVVSSVALSGATMNVDNLLATRADGAIFAGERNVKVAPTKLYLINPTTGVTTLVSSIPLALSGMTFDVAPTPVLKLKGPSTIRTSKKTHRLQGTYTSIVPGTITAGKSSVAAKSGPWSLTVRKLKPGTNTIRLKCVDAVAQTVSRTVRILVED
jgi:hypothetical protein